VLTADLVRVRRVREELRLVPIKPEARSEAAALASRYVRIAESNVGCDRSELMDEFDLVPFPARDAKLAGGLVKLVLDRCEFESQLDHDPSELRHRVFSRAAADRRALAGVGHLDREALLDDMAREEQVTREELTHLLYADLKENHRLIGFDRITGDALLTLYELSSEQAVLLKAERVVVVVHESSPAAYRHFFRKLKFLRLLHRAELLPSGAYQIEVDGPFSLFSAVTKYGLSLAMLMPVLRETERFSMSATVRWGKERRSLRFALEGGTHCAAGGATEASLPDEVAALWASFEQDAGPWRVARATRIFSLPGVGVLVPDLTFVHAESGFTAHLEVLGYWSREAVFQRIDLLEAGAGAPFVFAVPARLRVSEEVLPDDLSASLYVYKGVIRPKLVRARLDALAARAEEGVGTTN